MYARKLIILLNIIIFISLIGCSSKNPKVPEKSLTHLLNEGWEFFVYDQGGQYKLVLQKETNKGVQIIDYFNSMDKNL